MKDNTGEIHDLRNQDDKNWATLTSDFVFQFPTQMNFLLDFQEAAFTEQPQEFV